MDDARSPLGRWLKVGHAVDQSLRRWMRGWALGFTLSLIVVGAGVGTGFFKNQAQLRQARSLIEKGLHQERGPLFGVLKADGVPDPEDVVDSPGSSSRWSGTHRFAKQYDLELHYHAMGRDFQHRWVVDLADSSVRCVDQ